jgi:hypothetical protein
LKFNLNYSGLGVGILEERSGRCTLIKAPEFISGVFFFIASGQQSIGKGLAH